LEVSSAQRRTHQVLLALCGVLRVYSSHGNVCYLIPLRKSSSWTRRRQLELVSVVSCEKRHHWYSGESYRGHRDRFAVLAFQIDRSDIRYYFYSPSGTK
jgi:hypothetical protein